ncbi:hypothetical protein Bca4012_066453 [Brassica carinata]
MSRRLTSAEKGKSQMLEFQPAPRTARVRVAEPDNSELLRKHALTLIGRVTNPSVQKVWSLIPFFTDHWRTEIRPVGSDLGQGLFQFQFELESDLLMVLDHRPYHFAKWMIILQRWEPTLSPSFPSIIPFWIKVQGLPVHLWTEDVIRAIGADIGTFEKSEITSLTAKMRVHVNGRLPLIMASTVEYPNGDEVKVVLVYEKLEKHCSVCARLDHDVKDCLEVKHQRRALATTNSALKGKDQAPRASGSNLEGRHSREREDMRKSFNSRPTSFTRTERGIESRANGHRADLRDSLSRKRKISERDREDRYYPRKEWVAKDNSHMHRECDMLNTDAPSRRSVESVRNNKSLEGVPSQVLNQARDVAHVYPKVPVNEDTHVSRRDSSGKRDSHSDKGVPLQRLTHETPLKSIEEARVELRDALDQYTCCADPIESAVRKERLRQGEAQGKMEESAVNMVKIARARQMEEQSKCTPPPSLERIPLTSRLGPLNEALNSRGSMEVDVAIPYSSPPRLPRPSMALRLGPVLRADQTDTKVESAPVKRKPGRPPGRRTLPASPGSKNRKVQSSKPPNVRKKLTVEVPKIDSKACKGKSKGGPSRPADSGAGSTHSSENIPLSKMIPKSTRRKADFRLPSAPAP